MYNIGYLLFFRSSLFKIFRNVLCNKRRKEQMGYKTNYSYLYNVICVHVNCGSARNGTILIKKSSGKNENTFYLEDFYFKNIIIIIYSTPRRVSRPSMAETRWVILSRATIMFIVRTIRCPGYNGESRLLTESCSSLCVRQSHFEKHIRLLGRHLSIR